MLQKQKVF